MMDREERLTARWGVNPAVASCFDEDFILDLDEKTAAGLQAVLERLADYEDADCNGELLRLPCPIGSRIFIVSRMKNGGGHIYTQTLVGVHLRDERSRRGLRRKAYIVVRGDEGFSNHLNMDKQSVVWFTDHDAARAALCGLHKEEST